MALTIDYKIGDYEGDDMAHHYGHHRAPIIFIFSYWIID